MTEQDRQEILEKSKIFFREKIANNHKENVKKLKDLSCFNVNPFLHNILPTLLLEKQPLKIWQKLWFIQEQ